MKTLRTLIVITIAVFGFTTTSFGQVQISATQTAKAKVIKTLTISSVTPLDFGTFGGLSTGTSTVIIDPNSGRSATSTAMLSATGTGAVGTFSISGEEDATIAITLPASNVKLTNGTPADDMTIEASSFTTDQSDLTSVTLPATPLTLKVGATLTVGTNQKAGSYTGDYSIIVNYN